MTKAHHVALLDTATGAVVDASLFERIDIEYARRADDDWLAFLAEERAKGKDLRDLEHDHWRWKRKLEATSRLLSFPTLAIDYGGQAQGLMLVQTDGEYGRTPSNQEQPLVYVEFLASAPWNLRAVVEMPRFKGVGTILIRAAIELSRDLGFGGRIGLHSLKRSEAFYERIGMECTGPDESKGGLKGYEMTVEQATVFCSLEER